MIVIWYVIYFIDEVLIMNIIGFFKVFKLMIKYYNYRVLYMFFEYLVLFVFEFLLFLEI